ncbi:TPA: hypothetical protein DF272_01740 [Candidatus Falkowbacteria bacterium]|nr:hypothetical protein [Candidatus Falkowbacteria bacterium]
MDQDRDSAKHFLATIYTNILGQQPETNVLDSVRKYFKGWYWNYRLVMVEFVTKNRRFPTEQEWNMLMLSGC